MALSYCSSKFYIPTAGQISYAQKTWPEADSSYLVNGYNLYKNKCGSCHYLYKPQSYTVDQWNKLLPEMKEEAKLTDVEYNNIKIYLLTLCDSSSSN